MRVPQISGSVISPRAGVYLLRFKIPSFLGGSFFISYFHTQTTFKEIITYDGEWVKNSFITVSGKPGIGVEINEAGMKKYAIPGVPFFE